MNAIALAGPAVEPVTLAEMKAHLRIDDTAEDVLIASLVTAARATVEGATRLALIAQTWRVTLPCFPAGGRIPLPLWPILSVEAVRFVGDAGTVLVASADYRLERNGDPVVLAVTTPAPATPAAVTIDLTAGFGPNAADPPPTLRLAIQRLAARWWAERGDGARPSAGPLDPDIAALVSPLLPPEADVRRGPTIGERARLFTLELPIDTPDGFGGAIRTFQPGPVAWGAIELLRQAEERRADEREAVATHRVTLPWRDDMAGGMRLACGPRRFRVRAADDPDGSRRDIICLVEEIRP